MPKMSWVKVFNLGFVENEGAKLRGIFVNYQNIDIFKYH